MTGFKISNIIGKMLIILSLILLISSIIKLQNLYNQDDMYYSSVIDVPANSYGATIQYTIVNPFAEDYEEEIFKSITLITSSITLLGAGLIIVLSTRKKIQRICSRKRNTYFH